MKKVLLTVALAGVLVSPAMAADMPRLRVAQPPPPPAAYSWTGCYGGSYNGGAFDAKTKFTDRGTAAGVAYNDALNHSWSYSDGTYISGGTIGCNWQAAGSQFVWGLEGEVGFLQVKKQASDPTSPAGDTIGQTRIGSWDGMIAGRLGWAWDRVMVYAKGGVAFLDVKSSVFDVCNVAPCGAGTVAALGTSSNTHFAAGGGIEYAFGQNWSVKGEYMVIGIDRTTTLSGVIATGPATGQTTSWLSHISGIQTFKVGVNYKLYNM